MIKDSLYYAKILLFGEYGIIENSMGLSIPYHFSHLYDLNRAFTCIAAKILPIFAIR